MAAWGKGDPRWIVEERADAKNVNNWHWSEKNANLWSKSKLRTLLEDLEIKNSVFDCKITEITSIDGEAVVNNRKAKLIFLYEWVVKGLWQGCKNNGDIIKGTFEIPNLSDENPNVEDVDVDVTLTDDNVKDSWDVKEYMRKDGIKLIRQQISKYIHDLKEDFSEGLILPTKTTSSSTTCKLKPEIDKKNNTINSCSVKQVVNNSDQNSSPVCECSSITLTEEFKCEASQIYMALTEPNMVSIFTRSQAVVEPIKGGNFQLFDGNVVGEFTELIPNEQIVMKWRFKDWPINHFSIVTLKFIQKNDGTSIELLQTDVPTYDLEKTRLGWANYYWRPIMQSFGFGAGLYG